MSNKRRASKSAIPPYETRDLPTPEQVFRARRIGLEEMITLILGPGVIALGLSIGSGEWLLAPLSVSQYGFRGIAWVILISAVLQVFYNVELARYTIATGETPLTGFGRAWPGKWLWIPLALAAFYASFILGGWSVNAGASLFALVNGRSFQPEELLWVRLLGIGLMLSIVALLTIGRKLERTMETIQGVLLPYVLIGLFFICLIIVPADHWLEGLTGLFLPAAPPPGSDISLLGGMAGFTALAAGLNFMFITYYRDKGYGMGARMGYLTGLFSRTGGSRSRQDTSRMHGFTFPETETNSQRWKAWFRLLLIDQWAIYFPGVILGALLPALLVSYLVQTSPSAPPDQSNIMVYAALRLGEQFGPLISGWTLLTGFVIMFSTQTVILDLLARNLTEGLFLLSNQLKERCKGDPRRIYYPALLLLVTVIGVFIFTGAPTQLTLISGNIANFAALIFPLLMIYLNRKLPKPARITWWSIIFLALNVIFFGFFFINFIAQQISGRPVIGF